jgi:signal transduction histidine kinase
MARDNSLLEFSALSTVQLAHELQNLLAIMSACVDALVGRLGDDADLTDLSESIDSAFHLSNDILAIVGLQTVREPVLIEVSELLERCRRMLQRIVGKHIELVIEIEETPALIEATPVQLEWMLLNLAANGRDAMPEGGVLHIETAVIERLIGPRELPVRRDPYLRLTVRDEGQGIADATRQRIFEPFFSTDVLGIGLGLTSVAVTVRALKGWLYVESVDNSGTAVHVLLPLYSRASPAGALPS